MLYNLLLYYFMYLIVYLFFLLPFILYQCGKKTQVFASAYFLYICTKLPAEIRE